MSRTAINFLVDVVLLVIFLTLLWTAVVLRFVFPPGAVSAGWSLWGRSFDDWVQIQFVVLTLFALTVLLHVMLHWSWVCGVVTTRLSRWRGSSFRLDEGTQTLYGVGLLIVAVNIVGLLIAWAALSIQTPQSAQRATPAAFLSGASFTSHPLYRTR